MAKLTKAQAKAHTQACDLLTKPVLSEDDKEFVFRNWQESATHVNGADGAFFTPYDMAFDFALDVGGSRVIDLCAGIGMLSYAVWYRAQFDGAEINVTCVERNPDYVAAGKKLLPSATWIQADVFDVLDMGLGHFDYAISNPPFGKIKREKNAPRYTGAEFEFHVIDIAAHLADRGTFIVPQMSAGFNFSGRNGYERQTSGKAFAFQEMTGHYFEGGCGVDTAYYQKEWRGVSPLCEIVCVEFDAEPGTWLVVGDSSKRVPIVRSPANDNSPQLSLFGAAPAQAGAA